MKNRIKANEKATILVMPDLVFGMLISKSLLDAESSYFTPAAAANPADTAGGMVLTGGGSAKEEFLALIALE